MAAPIVHHPATQRAHSRRNKQTTNQKNQHRRAAIITKANHHHSTSLPDALVLVPLRFQLVASSRQGVQDYRLTGAGPLFGAWDIHQAPRLMKIADLPDGGTSMWGAQFDVLPGRYIYKVL